MRPVLGPVLSVVRAAAHADARLWTHAEVRGHLGLGREPSPAERELAVPRQVAIIDPERESMHRVEQRQGL